MNTFFVLNFNAFDIKMKAQNIKKRPWGLAWALTCNLCLVIVY